MKKAHRFLAALFVFFCSATLLQAASAGETRLILKGHDPVAYFTERKPVKGDPKFSHDWDEGRYYFANARNRDTFAADPERYAPQFGGYCTGSMARGVQNEGHPEAWVIVDGRLYVFGAPDAATAAKHKEAAEKDLEGFVKKSATAGRIWRDKRGRS